MLVDIQALGNDANQFQPGRKNKSFIFVCLALAVSGFNTLSVLAVSWHNPVNASVISQLNIGSVQGSGVVKTESRKVSTFTSVDVSGSYDVEIVSQQTPSLIISGDDNILPLIITEVRGNTLFIYNEKSFSTNRKLKIKVSSRNIEKVSVSGANDVKISNVNNESLNIAQSGSGTTEISGKTKQLYITASGAVDVDAKNLYSEKVKINISGASNADVYATEELNVRISGAGDVDYYGNPKTVIRNIAGVGSLNKK